MGQQRKTFPSISPIVRSDKSGGRCCRYQASRKVCPKRPIPFAAYPTACQFQRSRVVANSSGCWSGRKKRVPMARRAVRCLWIAAAGALAGGACSGVVGDSAGHPGQIGNQNNPNTGGSGNAGGGGNGNQPASCTQGGSLAPARVWRLTDQQYVNVVAQVFGVRMPVEVTQAQSFSADFTATSESPELTVQSATVSAYASAARLAATNAVA